MKPTPRLGNLELGMVPRIVGVISSPRTLRQLDHLSPLPCDAIELRLDLLGSDNPDWMNRAIRLIETGMPVILTIRHPREGGHWYRSEEERVTVYRRALPYVSAIDVEIDSESMMTLAAAAVAQKKLAIGSFHDFERTPPAPRLQHVIEAGIRKGAQVVKIATLIKASTDVDVLRGLLEERQDCLLSLMGMGELGADSRISLSRAGSCLVYGFLDEPTAPGQISCEELRKRLAQC